MRGFTMVELLIVVAILATIAALAIPRYRRAVQTARLTVAVREVSLLQSQIDMFELREGRLPTDLGEIDRPGMVDPWGNPYEYLDFSTVKGKGKQRKDRFLVPINTTYDLYSVGRDGLTAPALTAAISHDDVIRANDGDFVGLAIDY